MAGDDLTNPEVSREVEEEAGRAGAEEEDTGAQISPIVKLEEVAVTTGEEDEDVLLYMKAKLYRFDKDGNQWKERGVGTVKLLKHKETGKVRLVMRQSKTLKICANHLVLPSISLQEHAGNEKSCVWHAADYSDGELKKELFCIRFATVENAKKFMQMVEEIAESEAKISEEEDEAAAALKELKVEDKKEDSKEKVQEEKIEVEKLEAKEVEKEEEKPVKEDSKEKVQKEKTEVEKLEAKEVEKEEEKPEKEEEAEKPEKEEEAEKPETKLEAIVEPVQPKQGEPTELKQET